MRTGIAALVLAILLTPAIATSQNSAPHNSSGKGLPATAFKLVSVQVKGAQHYQQSQIVAASGLELGQTVGEEDFKKAVQRLGDTGAFTEVAYSFQYSAVGTKLEIQISENEKLVPTRFDNLVWFTDQELLNRLQASVPLFQGQLPLAGNLADQVSQTLQSFLDERNVQGRVDYLRSAPENGPIDAIVFSVTGPKITIRNTEFPGAAPPELPLLLAAARKSADQDYLRSILRIQEEKNFLPVYLARGYLKAAFEDAQAKVAQDSPEETIVDVTFPVEPGRQYKVAEVHWTGNSVFPAEKLQPLVHLQAGQAANAVQLVADLEDAKKLYGTRGYLAASVQPIAEFDDASSTVSYRLQVHEGDLYRMGELEIHGLDARNTARLGDLWKLHAGDPFDDSYTKTFLDNAFKVLSLAGRWDVIRHQTVNEEDKTVDVALHFEEKK